MSEKQQDRDALLNFFAGTLQQTSEIAEQLAKAEHAKAKAASDREHALLDPLLREEQALLLKLRGLEQQREHQAEELGWKGLTFRQILDAASKEEVSFLSPLFHEMQRQVDALSDAKDSAGRIVSVRLRELEHSFGIDRAGGDDAPSYFHDRYV